MVDLTTAQRQLHVIRVTMRAESRRASPDVLHEMRLRAFRILDGMAAEADADLLAQIDAVREEIR